MARKWSNLNLPGALHYITGNFLNRTLVFTDPECCKVFLDELHKLNRTGDEPLAVDHDWWWPEGSEKLSKAIRKWAGTVMEKGDEDMEFSEAGFKRNGGDRVHLPDLRWR